MTIISRSRSNPTAHPHEVSSVSFLSTSGSKPGISRSSGRDWVALTDRITSFLTYWHRLTFSPQVGLTSPSPWWDIIILRLEANFLGQSTVLSGDVVAEW